MRLLITWILIMAGVLGAAGVHDAIAQEQNLVGVYSDEEMSSANVTATAGEILTVYVVLADPQNPHLRNQGNEIVDKIGCYSFTLDLSTNLELVTKASFPARPICTGVCTEYRTCFDALLPVGGDRHITLRSFDLRYEGPGPAEIRLRPHSNDVIIDKMDYWYRDADLTSWILPMYPVSGSFDIPVFVINGDQVPTSNESWGSLKSTYR